MQNSDNTATGVRMVEVGAGEEGQRIDNYLIRRAPGVPRSHIYHVIRKGRVRVNGGRVKPTRKLVTGDVVRIPPMQLKKVGEVSVPDALAKAVAEAVVVERDDFLVLNKPQGLAVHGGSGLAFGAIDALRQARGEPELELVHRLDRGTSGCLLVARNPGICRAMQNLFRERKIRKFYNALVDGVWVDGNKTVDAPLEKNKEHAGERRVIVSAEGQTAVSHFSCETQYKDASFMRIEIETGRTHQIRVHAKHCGHAVIGDTRYGSNANNATYKRRGLGRLYLHSECMQFQWQGDAVEVRAPLGSDWEKAHLELSRG